MSNNGLPHVRRKRHNTSIAIAIPMPPPMHNVATP
jgi:hypothetical protein